MYTSERVEMTTPYLQPPSPSVLKSLRRTEELKRKIGTDSHSQPVYPVENYTRQLQDFDNYTHLFYLRFVGRLTVHQLSKEPERVLELGCGTGLWAIEFAKEHTKTHVIGLDFAHIQPDLTRLNAPELAARIQWCHANFLEPLPFPGEFVDLVRIRYIGLGVPEDKWQQLLEEVFRVLRPGGHLEIIEEDEIFPHGKPPLRMPSSNPPKAPASAESLNSTIATTSEGEMRHLDFQYDPRDHTRLAESWKAMLQDRFISPRTLSILGFYLNSVFDRVEATPQVHMRLPPNSCPVQRQMGASEELDLDPFSDITFDAQPNPLPSREVWKSSPASVFPSAPIPDSATALQLARRLQIIIQCKPSMRSAYESLYYDPSVLPHLREDALTTARDEFEFHWSNWISDMTDRISMRRVVAAGLCWPVPFGADPTPSAKWRKGCGPIYTDENLDSDGSYNGTIFRTVRGFLAWKSYSTGDRDRK